MKRGRKNAGDGVNRSISDAIRELQESNKSMLEQLSSAYSGFGSLGDDSVSVHAGAGSGASVDPESLMTREALGDDAYNEFLSITDDMMNAVMNGDTTSAGATDDGGNSGAVDYATQDYADNAAPVAPVVPSVDDVSAGAGASHGSGSGAEPRNTSNGKQGKRSKQRGIGFGDLFDDDDDLLGGMDVDELLRNHAAGVNPRSLADIHLPTISNGNRPVDADFRGTPANRASNPNARIVDTTGAGVVGGANGGVNNNAAGSPVTGAQETSIAGVNTGTNDHANPPAVDDSDETVVKRRAELLAEAHEELDGLIGLDNVKRSIHLWESTIRADKERARLGLVPEGKENTMSYHVVFTGDPGTGKTSVARIYGKILTGLGVLNGMTGEIIETDRSGMVAGYAGQTAIMTNARCNEAIERGVPLFIDEVYQLKNGREDAYGDEAIATLLRRMENDRDNLVVIVAGYRRETENFLNTNPGLRSRFSAKLEFQNYSNEEMLEITELFARGRSIVITDEIKPALTEAFDEMRKTDAYANARTARAIFDNAVQAQSARYTERVTDTEQPPLTDEETREFLTTLTVEDVKHAAEETLNIARRDTTSKPAYSGGAAPRLTPALNDLLTDLFAENTVTDADTANTEHTAPTDHTVNNGRTDHTEHSGDTEHNVNNADTANTVDTANSEHIVNTADNDNIGHAVDNANSAVVE